MPHEDLVPAREYLRDWFHFLRRGVGNAERVERATRRLARKLEAEPVKKTNRNGGWGSCGARTEIGTSTHSVIGRLS
jgi:hypothetical protein